MSDVLVEKLLSRKLWAYVIGVGASVAYAGGLIDQTGLGAILAASAAYQVAEGLADFGQGKAQAAAEAHLQDRREEREFLAEEARFDPDME